jgi:3-hydroxyacyl-[acyl-carrier-protein] dehydratase
MMDIIKNILPHRYPFLLVDSILELEVNKKCKTLKNFSINEEFFQGHFPQMPVVPGVLIIESLAQTAALIQGERAAEDEIFMIVGVDNFKLLAQVTAGDQIICTANLNKKKLNMFFLDVEALVRKPDGTEKKCAGGLLKCIKVNTAKQ